MQRSGNVQPDCHLRAVGVDYSVPYRYVGQRLDVRFGARLVEVYDGAAVWQISLNTGLENYREH